MRWETISVLVPLIRVSKRLTNWVVDQLADLFLTTHTVKTQHVTKSRGRYCGDIELVAYLATEVGPVSLVLDLRITHVSHMTVSEVSLTLL
jgi:hypothetical protein